MSTPFFKEEFRSSFDAMTRILDLAVTKLIQEGWVNPEKETCVRMCLEEALVNAIAHGNEGDVRRHVRIEMVPQGDRCCIKIYDEGKGFMPEEIDVPDVEQLGGRGVCLMKHYMDELHYNSSEHCLEMTLCRTANT